MAGDKRWSLIKGVSQQNVSLHGFDSNELHASVVKRNTLFHPLRFSLSGELASGPQRVANGLVFNLWDKFIIWSHQSNPYYRVGESCLCKWSLPSVLFTGDQKSRSPQSVQTSPLNLPLPPPLCLRPTPVQLSCSLAREPFKALELHPFLQPDQ